MHIVVIRMPLIKILFVGFWNILGIQTFFSLSVMHCWSIEVQQRSFFLYEILQTFVNRQ